jgi:hypothetical protein
MGKNRIKPNYRRRVLRLPDLDHCKTSVLNSLGSPASRRVYEYAIDQFIAWYCSEPRLAFNRIVVVRYRMYLESRRLAANTINQQLAAVRRLAHEAADSGLLSPELAAGISRVKGVKQLGFRAGNWLSAEQSSQVLRHALGETMRAKRDYAMLAMLFGGMPRQVNESRDVGGTSEGNWRNIPITLKTPSMSEMALFRKLRANVRIVGTSSRSGVHTLPCRSRQCPRGRDAACLAGRSSADDPCHRCSRRGCPHQSPDYQQAAGSSVSGPRGCPTCRVWDRCCSCLRGR